MTYRRDKKDSGVTFGSTFAMCLTNGAAQRCKSFSNPASLFTARSNSWFSASILCSWRLSEPFAEASHPYRVRLAVADGARWIATPISAKLRLIEEHPAYDFLLLTVVRGSCLLILHFMLKLKVHHTSGFRLLKSLKLSSRFQPSAMDSMSNQDVMFDG